MQKKEVIALCAENGARDINVSLDSLDEELSDYINGVKGSWRSAISTIAFISSVFPAKDSICALGCVLSRYNLDEIDAILDFSTSIGWWLSLVPVHITTEEKPMNFRGYDEYFRIKESDHGKLKELISRLKKKKRQGLMLFDSDDYLDSIYHFVVNGTPNWRKKGTCDTPNMYFAILPDAKFAPCCDYRFTEDVYVYQKDFPKIYRSKTFRSKVKKIAGKCPGCNFGSFPEMTLSARSFSTIKERLLLQLKAQKTGLQKLSEEDIYKRIENIRKSYNIYTKDRKYEFRDNKVTPR